MGRMARSRRWSSESRCRFRLRPRALTFCRRLLASSLSPSSPATRPAMSLLTSIIKPLVYVSLPVFALKTFADTSPVARYYVRIGLYLSTLGVCSLWGVICSIGMGLTGHRFDVFYVVARSFYYLASRVISIRLVVEGEEYLETRPSVLVGNHQSMLDILYLGRCVRLLATSCAQVPQP